MSGERLSDNDANKSQHVRARIRLGGVAIREPVPGTPISAFRAQVRGATNTDMWRDFDPEFLEPSEGLADEEGVDDFVAEQKGDYFKEPDIVRQYLNSIGPIPQLSREGEGELAKRIEAGLYARHKLDELKKNGDEDADQYYWAMLERMGDDARQMMIQANLKLVVFFAKKYTSRARGMAFMDLIQEGNGGMIRAVEKFDYKKTYIPKGEQEEKRIKFSTHAAGWIKQAIIHAIAAQSNTIYLPYRFEALRIKFIKKRTEMTENLGREPSIEEIANNLGETVEKTNEVHDAIYTQPISLDTPLGDDFVLSDIIGDTMEVDTALDKVSFSNRMSSALMAMIDGKESGELPLFTLEEVEIAKLSFGLGARARPMSSPEISKLLGVGNKNVRDCLMRVYEKLEKNADHPDIKQLRDYDRTIY